MVAGTGRDVDSDEDDDSILMFAPHTQMLCGLKWVGGSGQASALLTASYDGSVCAQNPLLESLVWKA